MKKLITKLKESIRDKRKCLDFMMAAVIFAAAILELISWRVSIVTDFGTKSTNTYLNYWYPFLNSFVVWIFSVFFILKIFRYKACIYTAIISIIYFLIQSFNMSAYLFQFGSVTYSAIIYPTFIFSILGLTLIKITRWLLHNQR